VFPSFLNADINPSLLIFAYGAMACDLFNGPHRGRLYMVYTDATGTLSETDIFFIHSDDDGVTWSDRRQLNDDPDSLTVDQFHPWISVDEQGRVWVLFYDRRNDPVNNLLMDTYFTVSTDGGSTWRANERISTASSDPGGGSLNAGLRRKPKGPAPGCRLISRSALIPTRPITGQRWRSRYLGLEMCG